jgi:putative sigma-54 modulation protein
MRGAAFFSWQFPGKGAITVDLTVTGRHVDVTEAMRDHARQRTDRLSEHFIHLNRMQVTLDMDGGSHVVEIIATPRRGDPLIAHGRTEDMYAAIDQAADKIEEQLRRLKERTKDKRQRRPTGEIPPEK